MESILPLLNDFLFVFLNCSDYVVVFAFILFIIHLSPFSLFLYKKYENLVPHCGTMYILARSCSIWSGTEHLKVYGEVVGKCLHCQIWEKTVNWHGICKKKKKISDSDPDLGIIWKKYRFFTPKIKQNLSRESRLSYLVATRWYVVAMRYYVMATR